MRHAPANARRHPSNARNYLLAFAVPYVWLMPRDVIERGAHLIVSSIPRIPEVCVNPRAKNFHWADMTKSLFEAEDKGADNPVLLDLHGNVTEGPGFNVFAVTNGAVATPDRGVLEGITRLAVIEMCEKLGLRCEQRTVSLAELREADEIPEFLLGLRAQAAAFAGVEPDAFQHVLVTEYGPGAGIGWHRDKAVFGQVVGVAVVEPGRSEVRRRPVGVEPHPRVDGLDGLIVLAQRDLGLGHQEVSPRPVAVRE